VWCIQLNTLIAGVPVTSDIIGLFLTAASAVLTLGPILLATLDLNFQLDWFQIVIRELIHQNKKRDTTQFCFEFCRVYLVVLYMFGALRVVSLISFSFITLIGMIQNLCQLANDKLEYYSHYSSFWVSIRWNVICYNKLIICINVLQLVEIIGLYYLGAGMLFLVLFNFIVIRLYNIFPFFFGVSFRFWM